MQASGDIWTRITDPANLNLAWQRAVRHFATSTHFVDQAAVGAFGADITANLASIGASLARGRYLTHPLRATPVPKPTGGRAVVPEMRTVYWIHPADQVAWLAVVNVIGPALDAEMPAWSYGHRLQEGPKARSTGDTAALITDQLLWPPAQSWPLFQRHVLLSARWMRDGRLDPTSMSEADAALLQRERSLICPERVTNASGSVKFAALDFKSYTVSIDLEVTRAALAACCTPYRNDPAFAALVDSMLAFRTSDDDNDAGTICPYVPIGLIVQGFLNNVAMLPIDHAVTAATAARPVVHFRFVDDHVVLAPDPGTLVEWIETYQSIVAAHNPRLRINQTKLRPPEVATALTAGDRAAANAPLPDLDPDRPSALWNPVPVRSADTAAYSARPWPQTIDAAIYARLRGESGHGNSPTMRLPDCPGLSDDEKQHLAATLDRNLVLMRSFRDRRSMLRGLLLMFAKTGMPGLDRLTGDLAALVRTAPDVGSALSALAFQMLAPIVTAAALRSTDAAAPLRLRRGATDFLLTLGALHAIRPAVDASWPLQRSWINFSCGALVAIAALKTRAPSMPAADAVCRAIADLDIDTTIAPTVVLAWSRWFSDFNLPVSTDLAVGERPRV